MGVLETIHEDRLHWGFDFHTYDGKKIELAGFTSTCRPHATFLSDAEFFAYGCRGGEDARLMGGFNLLSEAKWVFTTDDAPLWNAVDSAPMAGRFAVRNTLADLSGVGVNPDVDTEGHSQVIRVYGTRNGDELLKVSVSPPQRPAGNFSLSPDGLRLAVLNGAKLDIYSLPPITDADRKQFEREQTALAPIRSAADRNVMSALTSNDSANGQAAESDSAPAPVDSNTSQQ
jgi:hypothetical protein